MSLNPIAPNAGYFVVGSIARETALVEQAVLQDISYLCRMPFEDFQYTFGIKQSIIARRRVLRKYMKLGTLDGKMHPVTMRLLQVLIKCNLVHTLTDLKIELEKAVDPTSLYVSMIKKFSKANVAI